MISKQNAKRKTLPAKLALASAITTVSFSAIAADIGIEYLSDNSGYAYIVDEGWSGQGFAYICLDGCYSATLTNGRWQRQVNNLNLGQTYTVSTQIDDPAGQVIESAQVTFSNSGSAPQPTATPVATPVPTPIPTPVPTAVPTPVPTPAPTQTAAPTPEPTPEPTDAPAPPASNEQFGIQYVSDTSGIVFRVDENFRANFHYLCLGNECYSATLTNGRWELAVNNLTLGETYTIKTQIDHSTGGIYEELQYTFTDNSGAPTPPAPEPTATATPTPAATATPAPGATATPVATPEPTTPPVAGGGYTQTLYAGESSDYDVFYDDNTRIVTHVSARGRRRHEPSGIDGMDPNGNPSNPNHFNYHFEYWNDRMYSLEIRDYVAHGQQRIQIELDTIGLHATNSANAGSNIPYVKCFKDYGNETGYYYAPPGNQISDTRWTYEFTSFSQDLDSAPGYNYESTGDISNVPFEVGQMMECEVTIRWQSIVDAGETQEANYYGEIFRYRIGQGGLVGYNRDPNNGMIVTNMSSMIGGYLTSPLIGYNERPRAFMQPSVNTKIEHLDDFLEGRRVMHTSFNDGSHWDPSNSSNGANPGYPALAKGIVGGFDDRCSDCHIDNGNGQHTNTATGFLTPRLVGLGLLEAIPEATIASWADPDDSDGDGISGRLSIVDGGYIGRFGYKATQRDLEHQVRAAAEGEMNVTSSDISDENVDQMVTYLRLLAVPAARSENLDNHEGMDEFVNFGCSGCHKLATTTGAHPQPELRSQGFRPFTDLLLHDLGEGEFRTTPLMGIGLSGTVRSVAKDPDAIAPGQTINMANNTAQADLLNNRDDNDFQLWHDGSCTGANALRCAINKHGGEGEDAQEAFEDASSARQEQLINFLKSI